MLTLGIETTCDEMAAAVVEDAIHIRSNVIASQQKLHNQFGGVYPEMASRQHVDLLIPTIEQALKKADITPNQLDLIAVAKGPGLIGPLFIGLNGAKSLSLAWNIPFLGVNHVEAHLYAAMMSNKNFTFPALGVVVSGGHTFLVEIDDVGVYKMIGSTVDDAIGEAFDKVAALLGLSYPGGPEVEQLAKKGDPKRFPFKAGRVKEHPLDFSFSGLKTNVLYTIKGQNGKKHSPAAVSDEDTFDIAASFQETALRDVVDKALMAVDSFPCKAIYVGGGVSNNMRLRQLMGESLVPVYFPSRDLTMDNAAMIAGLGSRLFTGIGDSFILEPKTRIPLTPRDC